MMRQPTDKQRRFAAEYLRNGRNAAEAYRSIYGSKGNSVTVAKRACELLKNGYIAGIVAEAEKRAEAGVQRSIDRYAVTEERIVAALARLGFYDARDIFEWTESGVRLKPSGQISDDAAAAITEISQTQTEHGGTLRVKLADKRAALVDLGKHMGMFVERREVGKPGAFDNLTPEQKRERAIGLAKQLGLDRVGIVGRA